MKVRWLIAQTIGPGDGPDPGLPVPYRVYYQGGGPGLFQAMHAVAETPVPYEGVVSKFVRKPEWAAWFIRYAMAEEVAFLLAIEEPVLLGRLFVTRWVLKAKHDEARSAR